MIHDEKTGLDYVVVHDVLNELKNSTRHTTYAIAKIPDDDCPTPTVQLRIHTEWTRKDGRGRPEEPEYIDMPAYKLVHLIQQQGTRVK